MTKGNDIYLLNKKLGIFIKLYILPKKKTTILNIFTHRKPSALKNKNIKYKKNKEENVIYKEKMRNNKIVMR